MNRAALSTRMTTPQRWPQWGVTVLWAILPLGFLAAMIAAPLCALLPQTTGQLFADVWHDGYMRHRIMWTVFQSAATCIMVTLLGVPLAWVLARFQFCGRRVLLRLLMLPFVMPTLVAGMGVLGLFGAHGLLWHGSQDTPYLLLYGNVFFNLPVLVRAALQGFCQVPASRLRAAQTLGASVWQRFWQVQRPVLLPWLAGGMCLVFLYCFSGFGLALLLGGEYYATVEVEIYQLIAYQLDMTQAGVLVWFALAITGTAGLIYASVSHRTAQANAVEPLPRQPVRTPAQYLILAIALLLLLICCGLPLLAIVWRALHAGTSWRVLSDSATWLAVANTLRFTAAAMLLAVLLGISHAALAHRMACVRGITFLPFIVSPVCVSFGLLLLYPEWAASMSMLVCTYALLAYPFITKDLLAAWDGLPEHYLSAARVLGANPRQVGLFVIAPLLRPALQRGLALAAATCVGEFAATLFLSRPEWQTLTTLIYQYLGNAGQDNYDRAMVLTLLLMAVAVLLFVVLEWLAHTRGKANDAAME